MNKKLNKIVATSFLILGLSLSALKVYADVLIPGQPYRGLGVPTSHSFIFSGAPAYVDLLVVAGVSVIVTALVAWLIVRVIRKRNATSK